MRFMMLIIPINPTTNDPLPDLAQCNEALQKAGILLAAGTLHPPATGTRITFPNNRPKVTDNPSAKTQGTITAYWIIQVKSQAEAIEWACRCPLTENETLELRQVK